MRRGSIIFSLFFLLLSSVAFAQDGIGRPGPEIGLRDLDGRSVTLASLRGKVVLVNFWGTWCRPCREEMPFLSELQRKYRDRGLVVLGIAEDTDREAIVRYLRRNPVDYAILADLDHAAARRWDRINPSREMPRSFVVDRTGIVRHIHVARRSSELPVLERAVERVLGPASPPSTPTRSSRGATSASPAAGGTGSKL